GSELLQRGTDYSIDYATGQVQFTNPDSLFQGGVSSIHAQFEERAAFAVAPTSIYGLAGKYDLGAVGSVNLLGLFQKEHTAFTRPPLGFEPSASFIGGVSTDLHFQPAWITAAVRSLPGVHSSAPSFLNVSAEVAQSRPSPNQLGQAYIEEFEAEAGRFVSLSENSWQWGSMPCGAPPSCATGAKGLTDFGVSSAGFDPANAATLTWQSLPYNYDPRCGCYDQAIQFTSQQIDPTIVLSGQTQNAEPVLWLALKPDSVLGLAHSGPPLAGSGLPDSTGFPNWVDPTRTGPRWRSITQVLSPTGVDLSRVEYLEFWVWEDNHRTAEQNRTAVVFDFGSVFEDAVAWQPLYFTHDAQGDTTYFGRRLVGQGRLDSERDPITKSWNAAINDEGILSDRVIAADGGIDDSTLAVHVDSMPLCSASVNGQIQPYAFGDLRSRCGRHNGFVDTEDQDGDFVLDVNAGVKTEENFTRFVFPIGDDRFFVRDGGMIGVKDSTGRPDGAAGWRLYRIPFRCDTCAVGNPDLRQVQSLRMTIVTPSGSPQVFFGLARIRLVGSTWLKRADTPIRGLGGSTGSGALGSQVIASVVSTENRDLGYTPPPGVTDQASRQDAGFQLGATQINERSMRLLATGLTKGERAEAFERFTDEGDKNFLKYRKLRVWARGRGPGWEDGDLEFYIKAGKDENNFYLYHTPVRTASWDPEVVASFQPWLVLRARIEQAWLAGDTAHVYPGCPDSTLVPYDTAYVMCDGPYIVHVRDPATAPPNLAAVQEMAAGIWRVNDRVFVDQAELWVDDIRLSDVVQDPGTAAALDVSLAASDLATVSFSLSRRDANFRQLGEDPSYVTNDAATLGATFRLDKFLPDRWGISAPFTMQLATTSDAPFYVSGTDIRADVLPGLRTPRSTAASYSLSLRHVRRSLSPWLRDFVDPVSFSASYATGDGRTSLEDLTSSSYVVNVDYNISPGASTVRAAPGFLVRLVQHLPPFLRDGLFFHSLTLARVRWNPSAIRFHSSLSSANASRFSFTVPVAEAADSTLAPTLSRSKIWRNTGSLELLPFNGLQLRVDLASQRDLRDYGDTTTVGRVIRGERRVFLGQDVGFETQRSVNTFLGATPQINSWLRPHVNLSSFFNLNRDPNGQVARAIGDTAGAFRLPDAFSNSRAIDLGTQVDARHLGTSLFGDSSKAAKLLARISSVDLGYTKSISSSFTNVAATPTLGYQLAFGGLDGVRRVNGVFAGAAARNTTARASVAALLPAGFRINTNYQRSSGITYVLRTDAQVPIRTQSRDWPSATLSWTYTPGAATLGKVLATLTASFNVRQHQSVAEQAGFTAGPLGTVRTSVTDRSASPSVSITWLKGIFTSFDATSGKTEQVSAGNVFRSQNAQRNAALSFSFRPPASVAKLPADIRTNLRYTVTSNTTCLQSAGQATCVPYVDSRQTQYQLTMDTSFPSNLSAGLQGAYLLNEERQTSRKVAQLVITAFVQLNTSVGQIQ
ncbi:MAG TPA: hypothetical protein VFK78_01465, partial [Gemmatimonadales bacterium]|nr:hypothetical protein [Gemmatimonadales bacterium]